MRFRYAKHWRGGHVLSGFLSAIWRGGPIDHKHARLGGHECARTLGGVRPLLERRTLIKQGHVDRGIPLLRTALEELQEGGLFTLYDVRFLGFLAEGLAVPGSAGTRFVDAAIRHSEEKEELWCVAELLRVKGEILWHDGARSRRPSSVFYSPSNGATAGCSVMGTPRRA